MSVITASPRHRVTIYRAETGYAAEDISADILEISTDRVYGRMAGGYTILTTFNKRYNGKRYDELLKGNDRVLIELDEGVGGGFIPVMRGLVTTAAATSSVDQEGRPMNRVVITGWDYGKLLRHNCGWDTAPSKDHIGSEAAIMQAISTAQLIWGNPKKLVKDIMEYQFFRHLNWTKPFILVDRLTTPDTWSMYDVGISLRNGEVWAALKYVANEPYNMLHCDTGDDGKFHIILEKCPYNNVTGKLERDTLHKLSDRHDIITHALRTSDEERINYIYYKTSVGTFGEANGTPLLFIKGNAVRYDEDSIKTHGFIPWQPQSNFVPILTSQTPVPPPISNDGSKAETRAAVAERTAAFWNWYRRNHEYEAGTFTLRGMPRIRCGDGCLREKTGKEYFIQQVGHRYVVGTDRISFQTSLQVTRGQAH